MFDNQNQSQPQQNPQTPSNLPFGKPQSPFASVPNTDNASSIGSQLPADNPVSQSMPNPQPAPNQIEDMFAGSDNRNPTSFNSLPNPPVSSIAGQEIPANTTTNTPFIPAGQQNYAPSPYPYNSFGGNSFPWAKLITISLIFVLVIGLMVGGYFLMSFLSSNKVNNANQITNQTPNNNQQQTDNQATQNNQSTSTDNTSNPVTIIESETDTDGDGLIDMVEETHKTDPKNPDTDNDGLTDYFEITIYKTDPLNPDTDSDGYKDGDEVINGYDPNKVGARLFEIPQE